MTEPYQITVTQDIAVGWYFAEGGNGDHKLTTDAKTLPDLFVMIADAVQGLCHDRDLPAQITINLDL